MNDYVQVILTSLTGIACGSFVVYLISLHMNLTAWERVSGNRPIRTRMSGQVGRGTQPERLMKVCRPEKMKYGWVIITVTRRSKVSYNRVVPEGLKVQVEWVPFRWVASRKVKR